MQKKQAHSAKAPPKSDTDAAKSPSNQKPEKKTKMVLPSFIYFLGKFSAFKVVMLKPDFFPKLVTGWQKPFFYR